MMVYHGSYMEITKEEAIKRLQYEKPNYQIAFRTQEVLDGYVHFEGSERL